MKNLVALMLLSIIFISSCNKIDSTVEYNLSTEYAQAERKVDLFDAGTRLHLDRAFTDPDDSLITAEEINELFSIWFAKQSPAQYPDDVTKYIKAYTDFLVNYDIKGSPEGFPVFGFYLVDINFDNIPELAVLHHSGGSMGGYFTFYYFNGEEIVSVMNDDGNIARGSNSAQLLADYENRKVYLFKEMYGLLGNDNRLYGYIREFIDRDGIPFVHSILSLEVDGEVIREKQYEQIHDNENEYLSDIEFEDCLLTKYNSGDYWKEITSKEYLNIKKEIIVDDNYYIDLFDRAIHYYLCSSPKNIDCEYTPMTKEEVEILFFIWFQKFKI